ncbi:hypothetical protein CA13_61590 [Planctomycetes bacterium CA13]|uniref:Uncharacterized protein n=1 Tax=Novipirellula herctigrandis TaxID=2527986 RepID=A0A5C5ZBB5_9BACT|nr:hypothetical protein CA13_61590 [Planctomycetes bacterium CA13]
MRPAQTTEPFGGFDPIVATNPFAHQHDQLVALALMRTFVVVMNQKLLHRISYCILTQ